MPIPDAQAAPLQHQSPEPLNQLAPLIIEIANKRLRGEIDVEEWKKERDTILKKFGYIK